MERRHAYGTSITLKHLVVRLWPTRGSPGLAWPRGRGDTSTQPCSLHGGWHAFRQMSNQNGSAWWTYVQRLSFLRSCLCSSIPVYNYFWSPWLHLSALASKHLKDVFHLLFFFSSGSSQPRLHRTLPYTSKPWKANSLCTEPLEPRKPLVPALPALLPFSTNSARITVLLKVLETCVNIKNRRLSRVHLFSKQTSKPLCGRQCRRKVK